ncbi:hypothetical protein JZO66_13075 [Enterococcus sp. DIV0242_7C1]|uniref:Uncharacterized protein n=1 Tax=Candidatus Enterococcus dunnyi TaxID=1834192 RepID=A0A200J7T8_9ENTE|nr:MULTISPECIES: hypothetical protein [unclassified Enterococcus]MBO0471481.1 hypothetical protein [Enterococcus sp. DIV0242_7C1]OUZ32645.1 hypothetical protein A5889_001354 [Enterococcus sp. 9D6_DIV0238]
MFELKYKIFNDLDDDLEGNEFYGENGYFQLLAGHSEYGFYLDKEVDVMSVSIYWWMRYFVEATLKLENMNVVYISDIETPKIWIELTKVGSEKMTVRKIEALKREGSSAVESDVEIEKIDWEEKIDVREYTPAIIKSCSDYLNDLRILNTKENVYIQELEELLKQLKKANEI